MGFYGNITNTAKTQFSFDRVFSNRKEMDKGATTDGIYPGRYVLVEYDTETNLSDFLKVDSIDKIDGKYYANRNNEIITLRVLVENRDPFVYTAKELVEGQPLVPTKCKFYICTNYPYSETGYNGDEKAIFAPAVDSDSNYVLNYNIDQKRYKEESRGYDSTVWMKTFSDGVEKYISIAELNSVVPTFAISADAPTMIPDNPHFDTRSTDVYYELHVQPQWGFRIKEGNEGKSDEITIHQTLDPTTGEIGNNVEKKADIYYNAAGFDPTEPSIVEDNNYIKIEPTGKSGRKYNTHVEGNFELKEKEDIQELSIHLPAIGNMMSKAWDIIHGPGRNDDMRQYDENGDVVESLQGRLDSIAKINANEIPVKRILDGRLVGTKINGDNNKLASEIPEILVEALSTSLTEDDAWIYTKIDSNAIPNEHNNGIAIHHTYHPTDSSTSSVDKNNGNVIKSDEYKKDHLATENLTAEKDKINLYVPYVDAAGHVVGKNIETITLPYSYRTYTTSGLNNSTNDLYTSITEDENGAHTSAASANLSQTVADETQDSIEIAPGNKWIQTKFEDDKLTIVHEIHAIPTDTHGTTNTNKESDAADKNNINIPDWEYDKAGHIIEKHDHFYTLPFGFKTIITNGRNDDSNPSENATGKPTVTDIVADNTQDILAINSGNKWIRIDTDVENDAITISHDVHNIEDKNVPDQNLSNTESADVKFIIPTYAYDKAGHIISKDTKTLIMPFGYGIVTADNKENAESSATYDTLSLSSGDNWLTTEASKDTITFYHNNPTEGTPTNNIALTPKFGDSFILTGWDFDSKGHKFGEYEYSITIPQGSLTDEGKTESNIITGLAFNQSSGALSTSRTNISELKLDGSQFDPEGIIKITDTLGEALNNLQGHTNRLTTEINTALIGEIKRSQDKDDEHTTAINNIYTPATETTEASGYLAEEINRSKEKDDEHEDAIGALQQSVADIYTPATETTEVSGYLAEEIDRAKTAEIVLNNKIEQIYNPEGNGNDTATGILVEEISRSKEKDDEHGKAIEVLQQSIADIYTPANEETGAPASGILTDKYDENTEFEWGWGDEQLIETISTPGEQDGVQGQFETKIYSHPTQYETLQNILNEIYLKINNLESKPSNREEVTFTPNITE